MGKMTKNGKRYFLVGFFGNLTNILLRTTTKVKRGKKG